MRGGLLTVLVCTVCNTACGVDAVDALADAGSRVELGARWLRADTTRVALCRSDPGEGTCARIYLEGEGPGFPEGWQATVGHLGTSGPCLPGAIEPHGPTLTHVAGHADDFTADGEVQVELTATFEGGREVRFEGRLEMGVGPCP